MAAGVDDGFGIVEDAEGEVALAQVEPDALDRIELGTVRGQPDEGEVRGQGAGGQVVPAGAVEDDDGVDAVGQGLGEGVEEQARRPCGDLRQHEGEILAGQGSHRTEDVGPLVAAVAQARRSLAAAPPAMTDAALVADARLVLEPQLQALPGMGVGDGVQGGAKPPFWKRRCASPSLCGCTGRAFWREKPSLCSTRVRLEGW